MDVEARYTTLTLHNTELEWVIVFFIFLTDPPLRKFSVDFGQANVGLVLKDPGTDLYELTLIE
jgi:hypothetical protein